MLGRHREADPAFGFNAQHKRVQKLRTRNGHMFGQCGNRGRYRHRRMDDRAQMRVVEVEHVRADRIDERCVEYVEPLAPAEHGRLRRPREFAQARQRGIDGGIVAAAERAAEPVKQRALRLVPHFARQFRPA